MTDKDYSFFLQGTSDKGVLLVHGLTGSPAEMKFVGKHLNKLGFTVYAPVLAGHCQDRDALIATNYEDWLKTLHKAVDFMRDKVNEIHIAGICVGGCLSLYLASLEPRIKTVTSYSSALNYDGWNTPYYYRFAPYGIPILVKIPFIASLGFEEIYPYGFKSDRIRNIVLNNRIEGTLTDVSVKALYEHYCLNKALKKALPKIQTPTLLIHAKEDDVAHPRNAYKIQKLHGGDCKIELLYDSHHMIHVDQERHKVAEMTADFINRY